MNCSENISGTLRAQEHGHQPLVYENHGIDSRYTAPHKVAPTMSARYGTGGNNVPLVEQEADAICIAGNTVDRQPQNGGNGLGCMLSQSLKGSMTRFVFWDIVIFSAVIGVLSFYLMGVIERAITPAKRKAKKKAQ